MDGGKFGERSLSQGSVDTFSLLRFSSLKRLTPEVEVQIDWLWWIGMEFHNEDLRLPPSGAKSMRQIWGTRVR